MSKKHYINFGTAKTATSWIYKNLILSDAIDYTKDKEPSLELLTNFSEYENYYNNVQFGLNFNTNLWKLDSNQLTYLNSVSTHRSVIFRNPYSYANSLYNFWKSYNLDSDTFVKSFMQHFDYCAILNRLPNDTLVLYYDQILEDSQAVLNQITNYLEISPVKKINYFVNTTTYQTHLIFSQNNVILINDLIDCFQNKTQKDLEHWKMHV